MTQLPDGTWRIDGCYLQAPDDTRPDPLVVDRVSPKVLALLAPLTLVWGTNWPLFAIALDELPVATFRTIVLATAIAHALRRDPLVRGECFAVPKGNWPPLIAASVMNLLVWNIATSLAVLYIPSGHASVLAYTMPLWVALIGFVVFRQPLTGRLLLAILIGAAAVVALMVPNFASYAQRAAGPVLGPVRGLLLGDRHLHRQAHELAGHGPVAHLLAGRRQPGRRSRSARWCSTACPTHWPSAAAIIATIYTGAIPMALGTATWFALVKLLPAQVAALSSIAIPIVAIVSGVLMLARAAVGLQAVAIGSTVVSLWLALVPAKARYEAISPARSSPRRTGRRDRSRDRRRCTCARSRTTGFRPSCLGQSHAPAC